MKINKKIISLLLVTVFIIQCYTPYTSATTLTETNTQTIIENTTELKSILSDLKLIYQIITLNKIRAKGISDNQENIQEHNDIIALVAKELQGIKIRLEKVKKERKIDSNTNQINQNSKELLMLVRELQALNKIIIVKTTRTQINCTEQGKVFNLIFTAKDTEQSTLTYTVKYDPEYLELIDICNITPEAELQPEDFPTENITSASHDIDNGIITFTVNLNINEGQSLSGIINGIKFKTSKEGQTTVTTQID